MVKDREKSKKRIFETVTENRKHQQKKLQKGTFVLHLSVFLGLKQRYAGSELSLMILYAVLELWDISDNVKVTWTKEFEANLLNIY